MSLHKYKHEYEHAYKISNKIKYFFVQFHLLIIMFLLMSDREPTRWQHKRIYP